MTSKNIRSILIEGFDGIVCDLDGVIYRGHRAVPHAAESLSAALAAGVRVVFATNNASRSPDEVAAHLETLGLPGPGSRVVTSAQAGARYVAQRAPAGSRVLAIGGPGVSLALSEVGLVPVRAQMSSREAAVTLVQAKLPRAVPHAVSASLQPAVSASLQPAASDSLQPPAPASPQQAVRAGRPDGAVVAVLQGYGALVAWADLAEAAYAVQAGALWVATNIDSTLPTDRGMAPGNGALVGAVRQAVNADPVVVGKPHTPLYELSVSVLGTSIERTLAIGDRLDTDIVGAIAAGMDSLFVFGGVHGWVDVARAEEDSRPRYIATDLRSLLVGYSEPVQDLGDASRWVCGKAQASVSGSGDLIVSQAGALNERLRAALAALWQARDARGQQVDPRSGDGAALSDELELAVGKHG